LNSLQSDPNVPPQLLDLAAPIAQAMGALHQIERSNATQLVPHAEVALGNVRSALSGLQAQPADHPAVAAALEAVAGSLGLVHALSKLAGAPPAQAQPQAAPAAFPVPAAPAMQNAQQAAFAPTAAVPQYAATVQAAPVAVPQQAPAPQAQPVAVQAAAARPAAQQSAAPMPLTRPATSGGMNAPAGAPDATLMEAPLGTHSSTNFYKGLSGNDIIDHGGLFVSTYMIPKIGTPLRLRVSLPGGYEFEANAVVRWIREQSDSSQDAPPGFGAQFTQITGEARQLVYRYVRNREPLFHDDL